MLWEWQMVKQIEQELLKRECAFQVHYEIKLYNENDCEDCNLKRCYTDFLISNSNSDFQIYNEINKNYLETIKENCEYFENILHKT